MFNRSGALVLAHLLALACTPEIGDECLSASECVTTESDRLCLTEAIENFPGGYCTVFNCEPDSCPEEAVCVGYRTTLANSEACSDPLEASRLQRNYCMRACGSDSDCRGDYRCLDLGEPNPWGAKVLETGDRARSKICAPPYSESDEPERASDVCTWSLPENPTLDGGMSSMPPADAAAPTGDASSVESGLDAGDASLPVVDASLPDAAAPDAAAPDAAGADAAGAVPDAASAISDAASSTPGARDAASDSGPDGTAVDGAAVDAAVFDAQP